MSAFGEQIKNRIISDSYQVDKNERLLAASVRGKQNREEVYATEEDIREVERIARYFSLEAPERPGKITLTEAVDIMLCSCGAGKRHIRLKDRWWKDGDGVILAAAKEDGHAVALFPGTFGGFYFIDPDTGDRIRVSGAYRDMFEEEAVALYRPLPGNMRSGNDFLKFVIKEIRPGDLMLFFLTSVFRALIIMIPAFGIQIAVAQIIPTRQAMLIISLAIMMLISSVGSFFITAARFSVDLRIQNRLDTLIQNSVYYKVMNLPHSFFSEKTAGGLAQRINALNKLPKMLGDILLLVGNLIVAIIGAVPIAFLVPQLMLPAVAFLIVVVLAIAVTVHQERKLIWRQLVHTEESGGVVFDMISGIERIRISGSEKRAYAKWLKVYSKQAGCTFAVRFPLFIRNELLSILQLAAFFWAFSIAYRSELSVAQLAAFTVAFYTMTGTLTPLLIRTKSISMLGPTVRIGEPILLAETESGKDRKTITRLRGEIEFSHVTFSYGEDAPPVLNDFNLKIRAGEYVAIVGRSGCGKSTLVRLLLGFERPGHGAIYYDGNELERTDLRSLRKHIGTVLQDGKLFAGDIYSNIAITAPGLSMEEAWDAAEKAGMAEDIRSMPMGMHTMISEGGGGISGGQKQRLMIARAFSCKPGVLILDEATSALDNLTQKVVTESMDKMRCTRIVIAHRLSTIRECDRIIAMDRGRIVESGTYDELIEKGGFFADLVARQQIDEAK